MSYKEDVAMKPFEHMQDWKQNMDHFFGDKFWNEFDDVLKPPIPHINMYQTEKEIICYVSLPGIKDSKKIDIFVNQTVLELNGSITIEHHRGQIIKEEILHGTFNRKIDLPYPVREDKIDATYQYGLLVIRLHRLMQEKSKKQRLEIKQLDEE